jgi:hypothetical protein
MQGFQRPGTFRRPQFAVHVQGQSLLQTTVGVLQSIVGSADFLERAAEARVQIVVLDSGRVLLLEGERWNVAASSGAAAEGDE